MSNETETTESDLDPVTHLVLRIAAKNAHDLAFATNAVQDHLEYRLAVAEATLHLIRTVIWRKIDGDYTPTSAAIERALYPSDEAVKATMEILKKDN